MYGNDHLVLLHQLLSDLRLHHLPPSTSILGGKLPDIIGVKASLQDWMSEKVLMSLHEEKDSPHLPGTYLIGEKELIDQLVMGSGLSIPENWYPSSLLLGGAYRDYDRLSETNSIIPPSGSFGHVVADFLKKSQEGNPQADFAVQLYRDSLAPKTENSVNDVTDKYFYDSLPKAVQDFFLMDFGDLSKNINQALGKNSFTSMAFVHSRRYEIFCSVDCISKGDKWSEDVVIQFPKGIGQVESILDIDLGILNKMQRGNSIKAGQIDRKTGDFIAEKYFQLIQQFMVNRIRLGQQSKTVRDFIAKMKKGRNL
jgi:hypothetical protein